MLGFELHTMLALTGNSMRSWLQSMEFIACPMPCDAFCSMMGEIDYDISFHEGKELPFEKILNH